MKYILDQAINPSLGDNQPISYLIEDDRIQYISKSMKRLMFMKVDASDFFIQPGFIHYDPSFLDNTSTETYRSSMKEHIRKGCTTIVTTFENKYLSTLDRRLKEAKHFMINSAIDYVIGLTTEAERLTPQLIRACKRLKIPFIVARISPETRLETIPWGWIKESLFRYHVPIIPEWTNVSSKRQCKQMASVWHSLTTKHGIVTGDELPIDEPIQKDMLQKIGIYPLKGELLIGADLDYNLYLNTEKGGSVAEGQKLDYDRSTPNITVHKGKIIKVNDSIFYQPGYGREIMIQMPGYFATLP